MTEISTHARQALADISTVSTDLLRAELRNRGYDVLPRGLLQLAINEALEDAKSASEKRMVDGTRVVRELGRLAGEELPRVAAECIALLKTNAELERRAARAEHGLDGLMTIALGELYGHYDQET